MTYTERIGSWIQTKSCIAFYPLDPKVEEIQIEDIAHALSNQCRFAGHCNSFYSVANHSVLVAQDLLNRTQSYPLAMWGLHHDDTEAYLVDLPRPIKKFSKLGDEYSKIENKLMELICEKFDLCWPEPHEVKISDNRVLLAEKRDLLDPGPKKWTDEAMGVEPFEQAIIPWSPKNAKANYLSWHNHLTFNISWGSTWHLRY